MMQYVAILPFSIGILLIAGTVSPETSSRRGVWTLFLGICCFEMALFVWRLS